LREPTVFENRICGTVSSVNWIQSILCSNPDGGTAIIPTTRGLLSGTNVVYKYTIHNSKFVYISCVVRSLWRLDNVLGFMCVKFIVLVL